MYIVHVDQGFLRHFVSMIVGPWTGAADPQIKKWRRVGYKYMM
jgi:hypothetical protein